MSGLRKIHLKITKKSFGGIAFFFVMWYNITTLYYINKIGVLP